MFGKGLKQVCNFFLQKGEGREELRNCLKWDTFDEDRNMRKSIHLDLLHDSIMFASEKGFSWNKVAAVLKFSDGILQQIQGINQVFFIEPMYWNFLDKIFESVTLRFYFTFYAL